MMGWIKLYRQSFESAVFQNEKLWKVWCYCLLRANHKATKILWNGKEVKLEAGQFITGRFEGAKDCHMKPSTFWYWMRRLKEMKNVDITSDNKSSIVTVINWNRFQINEADLQSGQEQSDSVLDTNLTATPQRLDTDKNEKNQRMKEEISRRNTSGIPQIDLFKEITGYYPNKLLYDEVIALIGDATPDRLRELYFEWLARGYTKTSIKWLEWLECPPEDHYNNLNA
jgi:hypothetical protein